MFWSKCCFWSLWICCAMLKMCNVYPELGKSIENFENWSKKRISRLSMCNHSFHLWQVSEPKSHIIENRFVIELMSFEFQKEIHHRVHFPHVMRLTFQIKYKISIERGFNTWSSFFFNLWHKIGILFRENSSKQVHMEFDASLAWILNTMKSWKNYYCSRRLE